MHSNLCFVMQRGYRVKQSKVSTGVGIEGRDEKGDAEIEGRKVMRGRRWRSRKEEIVGCRLAGVKL